MSIQIPRILPAERARFITLALLLFISALATYSNGVVGTTGFISKVEPPKVLLVWLADNIVLVAGSGVYSLIVDRMRRERLALILVALATMIYIGLYLLFKVSQKGAIREEIPYALLMIINDQQWLIFPLLIWALANDLFSISEAKRLFPLLSAILFIGGIAGNTLAVAVARLVGGSFELLLLNAALMGMAAVIIALSADSLKVTTRQDRQPNKVGEILREGLDFVRDIPSYRYLTLAMILVGFGLNTLEYQFLFGAKDAYSDQAALQQFYGLFVNIRMISLLVVQSFIATKLIERLGFKRIFALAPGAMLMGLLLALAIPSLIGIMVGEYLTRIVMNGVDDPARRAFLGLVPDERRGRVSAFLDGYLYPVGSIVSCIFVGLVLIAVGQNVMSLAIGRYIYLGVSCVLLLVALWSISRFRALFDASMLNWRLRRRQRKSALSDIEF